MKLRTGEKLGRTVYLQVGDEPAERDIFLGIFDHEADAALFVAAGNYCDLAHRTLPGRYLQDHR